MAIFYAKVFIFESEAYHICLTRRLGDRKEADRHNVVNAAKMEQCTAGDV